MNRDKLEAEQRRMRQRNQPYPSLRGLRGEDRKRLKRRIAAHALLTHAKLSVADVADLPRLFKGFKASDLRTWKRRGMPLAD